MILMPSQVRKNWGEGKTKNFEITATVLPRTPPPPRRSRHPAHAWWLRLLLQFSIAHGGKRRIEDADLTEPHARTCETHRVQKAWGQWMRQRATKQRAKRKLYALSAPHFRFTLHSLAGSKSLAHF